MRIENCQLDTGFQTQQGQKGKWKGETWKARQGRAGKLFQVHYQSPQRGACKKGAPLWHDKVWGSGKKSTKKVTTVKV